jgi:Ca2+-binding EF-hand superfamily protein
MKKVYVKSILFIESSLNFKKFLSFFAKQRDCKKNTEKFKEIFKHEAE